MHRENGVEESSQEYRENHELSHTGDSGEVTAPSSEESDGNATGVLRVVGSFLIFVNIWYGIPCPLIRSLTVTKGFCLYIRCLSKLL